MFAREEERKKVGKKIYMFVNEEGTKPETICLMMYNNLIIISFTIGDCESCIVSIANISLFHYFLDWLERLESSPLHCASHEAECSC